MVLFTEIVFHLTINIAHSIYNLRISNFLTKSYLVDELWIMFRHAWCYLCITLSSSTRHWYDLLKIGMLWSKTFWGIIELVTRWEVLLLLLLCVNYSQPPSGMPCADFLSGRDWYIIHRFLKFYAWNECLRNGNKSGNINLTMYLFKWKIPPFSPIQEPSADIIAPYT